MCIHFCAYLSKYKNKSDDARSVASCLHSVIDRRLQSADNIFFARRHTYARY